MNNCFLQVGNYTSQQDNRGFFSRGAKDISALGDVYFESIKDNKYSKILLDKNARGNAIFSNINITDVLRKKTEIIENGTRVTIELNDGVNIPLPKDMLDVFIRHISLRNILSNKNCFCDITFEDSNQHEFNYKKFSFKYLFPQGEILLYLSYIFVAK